MIPGRHIRLSLRSRKPANAKLTEARVREIKLDIKAGLSQRAVARKRKVPPGTVSAIASGLNWGWVQ